MDVEETAEISDHAYALIFKDLIRRLEVIIKIQFVAEARAATTGDTHPNEIIRQ